MLLEGVLIPVLQYSWWRAEADQCIDAWWHGVRRPQTNKNHARRARAEQPKLLVTGKIFQLCRGPSLKYENEEEEQTQHVVLPV